ncbi:hypothetical protein LEP1GSC034_2375 [Leptospira interrogans str. 2003000735]|nr:hypothetical protein LEP1GSC025_3829 [Leptospira interrogans str. 2002000621]EMJ67978.1 hypothetical protein LEP1GSC034_2375 [Leptospira interrogans str. 2003000735]EMJ76333.1 hypothetical protein LEP1GSC033_0242 [Leptospira interrogans str. 2002000632]EMJ77409.1 hypothetical protein LEP1GSC032_4537 [Leptospira interrogans str. 2002000631]
MIQEKTRIRIFDSKSLLRNNLVDLIASLLSVLILSEFCLGIFSGAIKVHFTPKEF